MTNLRATLAAAGWEIHIGIGPQPEWSAGKGDITVSFHRGTYRVSCIADPQLSWAPTPDADLALFRVGEIRRLRDADRWWQDPQAWPTRAGGGGL